MNKPEVAKLPHIHRGSEFSLSGSIRNITPLHDRVLVKRVDVPQSVVFLTDREKPRLCQVIALGPEANWGHEAGQMVLVSPSINMDYPDLVEDGEQYVLIQQADILGILELEEP